MKIVVLSGAGISAESGLRTFRDCENGLWNEYRLEDVCTNTAWDNNPTLVNDFYNFRRIEALNAQPNRAHLALAEAETELDIQIITTNVDDLHERAGSTKVMHLHGELLKARSCRAGLKSLSDTLLEAHLVDVGREGIQPFQEAEDGFLLRPHVVFFGEDVPNMDSAINLAREADVLIVVGTSLSVYPAASLLHYVKEDCKIFYIDPTNDLDTMYPCAGEVIRANATVGIPVVLNKLKASV